MSRKIIGATVGTPISPARLARELKPVKTINGIAPDENGNVAIEGDVLRGNKSGTDIVTIDDVSRNLHDLTVSVSAEGVEDLSSLAVTVRGKNLCHNDLDKLELITLSDKTYYGYKFENLPKGTYTLSTRRNELGGAYIYLRTSKITSAQYIVAATDVYKQTITIDDGEVVYIYLGMQSNTSYGTLDKAQVAFTRFSILMEMNDSVTDYEDYVEPTVFTPNEDGTVDGVTSIYPTTVITCEGANIEAQYNRDLNKAFAEVVNAIIALGGNV